MEDIQTGRGFATAAGSRGVAMERNVRSMSWRGGEQLLERQKSKHVTNEQSARISAARTGYLRRDTRKKTEMLEVMPLRLSGGLAGPEA